MLAKFCNKIVLFILSFLVLFSFFVSGQKNEQQYLYQSEREIPIVKIVDVLIIGGTVPAVSAALAAAKNDASVFLIAPRPYLGEDLCATIKLKRNSSKKLKTQIEQQIFGSTNTTSPMHVKGVLSKALTNAGIEFIFESFVTDIIWDENNTPAGVVIANRAGRQAILAKTIIDASAYANVCKMAGADFSPWTKETLEFERTVVIPGKSNNEAIYIIKKLQLPMPNLSFASFARAEQLARKETYTEGQLRASESLFFIPPNPVICKSSETNWDSSLNKIDHFQPKEFNNLFVLNSFAALPEKLKYSGELAIHGEKLGIEAARISKTTNHSKKTRIKPVAISRKKGDVKEVLTGLRPINSEHPTIKSPQTGIPVIGEYDIIVIGGGTSGAPSAIAAARLGMKVLVVEYLEGLGGMGTLGLIGKPYHGRKLGFAAEVPFPKNNIEPKMEWYRSELEKAGGDIWLGVLGCGAYVEKNTVTGAIVVTPEQRGVVKGKVIIDATGNADVAIAAGAEYMYGAIEKNDIALQGTGLPSRPLTGNYLNTDYLLVDETDMIDVWRTLVSVHQTKHTEDHYDVGSLIQNRERRRIVGDFIMNYIDQLAGRTYPDEIVFSGSDYDSHGYPSSEYFALLPHDKISKKSNHPAPGGTCYTPYRCLLPKNLEGILVTGLGISMERDASALIRMQLDLANQGYAAGVAATLAITSNKKLREIDIKKLQNYLVDKGNLPVSILNHKNSFPLSKKIIKQAVIDYENASNPQEAGKPLAIILTHKKIAIPIISKKYKLSEGKIKINYALILGMCKEKEGVNTLLTELENFHGWDDKIFQGSMADFAHLPTRIDAIILALGNSGDKSVIPKLLKLVEKLDSNVTLSHHRSLALALEKLSDERAAQPLAELLKKTGMKGHSMINIKDAFTDLQNDGKGLNPIKNSSLRKRTNALREIVLARALFKCGDHNKMAEKILTCYTNDMRGLFARHAQSILLNAQNKQ